MLIRNTEARTVNIGHEEGGHHILMPGVNDIPLKLWEKVKNHPVIKQKIKDEHLVLVGEDLEVAAADENEVLDLSQFKESKAVKVARETVTEDLLRKWRLNEKRPKVAAALDDQLKKLEDAGKPSEKKDDEGNTDSE